MLTVFRVQHKSRNIGPYQGPKSGDWYWEMINHHRGIDHPNKWEGSMDDATDDYLFGFSSLERLQAWFNGYLLSLIYEGGYIIAQYDNVVDYVEGVSSKQLAFIPTQFVDITQSFLQHDYSSNASNQNLSEEYAHSGDSNKWFYNW